MAEGRGITRQRSDCITPTSYSEDAIYGLKSMDGVVPKLGVGAIRINSDIVTNPMVGNTRRRVKVPAAPNDRYVGLVLLFSTHNGEPLAIFPDGVLQRMRVGATNGLGVKYMARENVETLAILVPAGRRRRNSPPPALCAASRRSAASPRTRKTARPSQRA